MQPDGSRYKVPQMGWNHVRHNARSPNVGGIPDDTYFYFVHSFYAEAGRLRACVGETDYGVPLPA